MKQSRGVMLAAGGVVALAALLHSQGCGDDKSSGGGTGSGTVGVAGNVDEVTGPTMTQAPGDRPRFAFWSLFGPSSAVAQAACTAQDIVFCLDNGTTTQCGAVDPTSCAFSVDIDVAGSVSAFFVKDDDQDGVPTQGEAEADLTNNLGDICEGLSITLNDVAIDFDMMAATAASVDRDPQSCPTPTPTETPAQAPTATPTNGTPAPTATPTETPVP